MTEAKTYLPVPIALQEARDFDDKPLAELSMRPPLAEDVFVATAMTDSEMERDALLFANLTDTSAEFIKSLAFFDYKRVVAAYGLFMLPIAEHLKNRSYFSPEPPAAAASTTSAASPSTS